MATKPSPEAPIIKAVDIYYRKAGTAPHGGSASVSLRVTWAGGGEDIAVIDHYMARNAALAPLLDDEAACRKVSVALGGTGLKWATGQHVPADFLWKLARAQDRQDDDGVPPHLHPLLEGPIAVDDDTSPEALEDTMEERLQALMDLFYCDPTPDGWRSLALSLMLDHPFVGISTPVDKPEDAKKREVLQPRGCSIYGMEE